MLGYDYPLLGIFWTMLWLFLWIAWIVVLFRVVIDVFRNKDMGGFAKALWVIFILFLPFLGVLIYLIANGRSMSERDLADAQEREAAFQQYVRSAAASGGTSAADELTKLAGLRDSGVITAEEFEAQKAKLLA